MAQEKDKGPSTPEADQGPPAVDSNREFDDAVTTEIPDVLARLLDGDPSVDLSEIYVTDIQLTARDDAAADPVFEPGLLLSDRFEIVELVHSGGMGHVYKAIDHRRHPDGSGQVHVAIKVMRPSVASDEKTHLTLEREAAKAQTLSHPNIISIFDFDDHEGQFFLVMEWLEGESVNDLLRRTNGQKLAPAFAWSAIQGAAAAVQFAHQHNVVHADINPSNIFITLTKDIKLLDFGVARYTDNAEHPEEDHPTWVTQTYASPEVLSGLTPVFEDDVFSLACVAYRLLSGNHPFGGVPSLVAKHKGISVEPVPGLPRDEWQILRRALAYERSERPGSVSEFVARRPSTRERISRLLRRDRPLIRQPLVAVAALVIVATGLWLVLRDTGREIVTPIESVVTDEAPPTEPVSVPTVSPAEALVSAASIALGDGQLVSPDENNARALFREALALEPANPDALRGLRSISDTFLEEARGAMAADDPVSAYAATAVAFETDPSNPAVDIVNQLLDARGNSELADARLAVATGDFDLATTHLSRAELYTSIDPAAIQSLRQQIAQGERDDQLLADLATADAHILAGRLLLPEGDSAHALLLELRQQHGDDRRVATAMERLGERLLTRAAFAAAATRVTEAGELLDAVDALGILAPEVDAARMALATADSVTETGDVAELPVAEAGIETVAEESANAEPETSSQIAVAAVMPEAAGEPDLVQESPPQATVVDAEPEVRRRTVQEYGIERYVAPEFPRRALRRGITGAVDVRFVINADGSTDDIRIVDLERGDVFADSATKAVRQWRFAPREKSVQAHITLRFDMAP